MVVLWAFFWFGFWQWGRWRALRTVQDVTPASGPCTRSIEPARKIDILIPPSSPISFSLPPTANPNHLPGLGLEGDGHWTYSLQALERMENLVKERREWKESQSKKMVREPYRLNRRVESPLSYQPDTVNWRSWHRKLSKK